MSRLAALLSRRLSQLPRIALPSISPVRFYAMAAAPVPPVAKKVPHAHVYHGKQFEDPYNWLRDDSKEKKGDDIMEHLKKESDFAKEKLKPYEPLSEQLYNEMLGRIQEDDTDVPVKKGEYFYYKRTEKGKQYPYYCRKKGNANPETPEEILLDMNSMTEEYLVLGAYEPSPSHELLAYSLDTRGDEFFTVYIKDLNTGKVFEAPDVIEKTDGTVEWTADSKSFYYMTLDAIQRPDKLFRHVLGTDRSQDIQLFHEPDEKFRLGIGKTNSEKYILMGSHSSLSTEMWVLDAENPDAEMKLFFPRTPELSYSVDHQGDQFLVLTNDARTRINYRLVSVPCNQPEKWGDWSNEVIPYDPYVHLTGIECFKDFIAVFSKSDAVKKLRIIRAGANGNVEKGCESYLLEMPEEIYALYGSSTSDQDYNSTKIRFSYSSPITPSTLYEYDVESKNLNVLKKQPVPNFDPSLYAVKRLYAPIDPATLPSSTEKVFALTPVPEKVPITLIYRKDNYRADGTNPCLLYGYGSYGISMESGFKSSIFCYLDRGFTYAVAHIRGGGDCGQAWYENGKFMYKRNTFLDFIASAKTLVAEKVTSHDVMAIEGRSAGGLLIGATLNMDPSVCRLAFAGVPFVDVVNTMMDASIPLTVNEYEEWGNPNENDFFDYMLSYSPYDNVASGVKMPNILVKTGLWDPRVQYWEPSKWVAKLREIGDWSNGHELIYLINLGAGHFGKTGRYAYLAEVAEELAFVIGKMDEYRKDGKKVEVVGEAEGDGSKL